MMTSWLDLLGATLLFAAGINHLGRGDGRLRRAEKPWGDPAALLTAVLGGMLLGMGLVLILYSIAYAFISERTLYR